MSYSDARVEKFHKACFTGKRKPVKDLLDSEPAVLVNSCRSDGLAALHICANGGSAKLCRLLLDCGADLDVRESHGATPLSIAAQQGNARVARLLLDRGADVNARREDGVPPLFIAAQEGHFKVVEVLLAGGADKDFTRTNGATALYIAAQKGRENVVEVLLLHGAATDVKVDQATPLEAAVRAGHLRCAHLLIRAGGPVFAHSDPESPGRLDVGGAMARLDKSLVLIDEALLSTAVHSDSIPKRNEEDEKGLLLSTATRIKKKDLAKLSKKEVGEQCKNSLKTLGKVEKQLQQARTQLKREREERERELASWKAAYMLLQEVITKTGYTLPKAASLPSHRLEVGAAAIADGSDDSSSHREHIM